MTNKEKLNYLEELLDIEKNSLNEDTELGTLSQWDSMAIIATIAMFDSDFNKAIPPKEVREFTTVKDILNKME